jgi:flagellar biosynthesis protein FliR
MDLFSPGTAAGVVLFSARVGGLLLIAPMFASRHIPMMVKTGLLVVLTWVLAPVAMQSVQATPVLTPAAILSETMIGFAIGFGAAIFIAAAEAMGDLLGLQMGLSGAAALDPISFASVPVLGTLANLFALTLILALDGHLLMLDALAASTRILPLGGSIDVEAGAAAMVGLGTTLFALGFRFAAPVIATVILGNLALGLLSRAAPQLQVIAVAFPLQIGIGLLTLSATVPLVATYFLNWGDAYESVLMHLFGAFQAGGR